jgi:hypothetical protein
MEEIASIESAAANSQKKYETDIEFLKKEILDTKRFYEQQIRNLKIHNEDIDSEVCVLFYCFFLTVVAVAVTDWNFTREK